jgi:hypothetical protein
MFGQLFWVTFIVLLVVKLAGAVTFGWVWVFSPFIVVFGGAIAIDALMIPFRLYELYQNRRDLKRRGLL